MLSSGEDIGQDIFKDLLPLRPRVKTWALRPKILNTEVASITLHNTHKENKRAKSECSFAHLLFFVF